MKEETLKPAKVDDLNICSESYIERLLDIISYNLLCVCFLDKMPISANISPEVDMSVRGSLHTVSEIKF